MPRIVISYRRTDSDVTGRIFDRLVQEYGKDCVFRDIDNIPLGMDFRKAIDDVLQKADVLLAIIGPNWTGGAKKRSGKIFEDNDNVRIEIETVLQRNLHLIPVLVGNASMPKPAELPATLGDLAFRNATNIDSGRNFENDTQRLISAINDFLKENYKLARTIHHGMKNVSHQLRSELMPEFPIALESHVAEKVAPYLPDLRRYARALTGSQKLGDELVSATLDALGEEPIVLKSEIRDKVVLFRLLTKVRSNIRLPSPLPPFDEYHNRIRHIAPKAVEAFLLYNFLHFGQDEASEILGVDVSALNTLIYKASNELKREVATDALIIEDDKIIAMDLETCVGDHLGHHIIGIARTHSEAVALAKKQPPGLMLVDIQLADGSSGLDAANEILTWCSPVIVFVTAYPERFLTGERPEPAFLVAKPYQPQTVTSVVTSALFFNRTARSRQPSAQSTSQGQVRGHR